MTELNFCLKELTIKQFRSLSDYTLRAQPDFCEIRMKSEENAKDLCEFIAQFLYSPTPPDGTILLEREEKTSLLRAADGVRSYEGDAFAFTEELPGITLTGLEEAIFRELLLNVIHEGAPAPVSPALLDFCLRPYGAPGKLMSNIHSLDEKKKRYTTPEGTGKTDRALGRHKELSEQILAAEGLPAQKAQLLKELEGYHAKLDENAKRAVILKADMKNYADDVKLVRNRENASSLKNEIHAKEKKLRILKYEAQQEAPLPQPIELYDIKQAYADFSRVTARLCDAQNRLSSARDNLEFHEKMFEHADFDAKGVQREYSRIHRNNRGRLVFLGISAFLCLTAFLLFVLYSTLTESSLLFCGLMSGSVFLLSLMFFVASTMFSYQTRRILERLRIKTKKEFDELYQRLIAHKKIRKDCKEQIEKCQKQCEELTRQSEEQKERMKQLLSYTGRPLSTTAEITRLCDRILCNSEAIRELEEQLEESKKTYEKMLSADVSKPTLSISSEFIALERELDFLQRQTAALVSKKTKAEEALQQIEQQMAEAEAKKAELLATEREIEQLSGEYNSICALQKPHLKEAASWKGKLEELFCENADRLLRNIRRPDEHFALSDRLLPIIVCQGEITADEFSDSYIARAAMLVYKLLLSMEFLKKRPLFFYDGFSFADQKTAGEIIQKLTASKVQLISLLGPDSHSVKDYYQ